ncbi:phosphate/phosphite/phosphonate ABC transporter substrate-binding protein [Pseudoduganella armeniaca]|uniref:Phosphate ABC transporter substrate-binding protein n=1 Tax=Pseudoduganella armeniaca TaxID=2072590 RepID=A0A2R4CCF4_9BURK|nr:PhnD/SsuA/transferrin family substrate-binding protein [Pseudoduganella armeniaca]AVR97296.1 phosphate ABC transporter substrate-binding protein [Pseudoduganella armeniaca]
MNWTVALPMYNVSPRLRDGYEAFAAALLLQAELDHDTTLVRDVPLPGFWARAGLLLSQTCGYPYVTGLRDDVTLLATPCYDVPGCAGSDYRSALVVRAASGIATLADARGRVAAVNEPHSNSGMNLLRHAVAPLARDGRFFAEVQWSGSHATSVAMVQAGAADIAAIDCVTWAYLCEERPADVAGLAVLGYSAGAPGLPLVAGADVPAASVERLRAALLAPGPALEATLAPLRILGFAYRDDAAYGRIAQLEDEAVQLGYPSLA